ncbi:hypothetical protein ONZ51_g11264 [Trametes cubensis]|uniref:Galactose oxidase n=1 Tax=Trametes cubensis TaxID=1111947 RepID=A0AAD7X808_9APHY|nr:hypothetical protein ONZ51_g11264 [Trametes cubensis]
MSFDAAQSARTTRPSQLRPASLWSQYRLELPPPATISRRGVAPPTSPSPSPFPRYGHALPVNANASGELFLFGGLARETVKNDVYSISVPDLTATLLHTRGDIPSPRVGHASALVAKVLIIWGGDTRTRQSRPGGKQDNDLYMLNLISREWTCVAVYGPAPVGRYGHAMTVVGSKIYMFGGQVDGVFFNDLWSFDLHSLRKKPTWRLVEPVERYLRPPKRTSHTWITYENRIILFGGADCDRHYSDTWEFDTTAKTWSELNCTGIIPSPREGHSAAIVGHIMYIFGGRGSDGRDLGDLFAFDISDRRWHSLENIGFAPSPRSGHAMASLDTHVLVLGGLCEEQDRHGQDPEDLAVFHEFDTALTYAQFPDVRAYDRFSVASSAYAETLPPYEP